MAPFSESILDSGLIVYDTRGGPEFHTDITPLFGGNEERNEVAELGKATFDYGSRKIPDTELKYINRFFRARRGMLVGFRIKNWGDFEADITEGILNKDGVGNGTATYQLWKQYIEGSDVDLYRVSKPIAGTIQIYKNDIPVPAAGPGSVTYDYINGKVTFISLGGPDPFPIATDTLKWVGQFHTPVRFDTDKLSWTFRSAIITSPGVVGTKYFELHSLPIVEIPIDEV